MIDALIRWALHNKLIVLTLAVGLPTALPEGLTFSADDMLSRMKLDKKAVSGQLRFVLPTRIGHARRYVPAWPRLQRSIR